MTYNVCIIYIIHVYTHKVIERTFQCQTGCNTSTGIVWRLVLMIFYYIGLERNKRLCEKDGVHFSLKYPGCIF